MDFESNPGTDAGTAPAGSAADLLGEAPASAPAAAPADPAAPVDPAAPALDPDWYSSLSAETGENDAPSLRDWAKSAGVKDINGLAKIARDSMAALRDSGRVKVPGEQASEAEIAAFRSAIGVPDDPAGYVLPTIEGSDGKPVPLDEGLLGKLTPAAHKLGVPKAAYEGLVQEFVKLQLDELADTDRAQQDAAKAWADGLGAERTAKIAAVDSAARALELTRDDMTALRNSLGAAKALGILARIGEGMAEDVLLTGGSGRFGISGAEAAQEIERLKAQPGFYQKATMKGTPENARWNRLNDAVAAEEERQRRLGK